MPFFGKDHNNFLDKFAKPKTDTLLSLENVDSARAQLAVSVTVVSLATGSPPRRGGYSFVPLLILCKWKHYFIFGE